MRRKSLLLFCACVLLSMYLHATSPTSLSLKGTALIESQEAIPMNLNGNIFEIVTALQTGEYYFEGDNSIVANSITVNETAPFRIRVNYSTETPTITVQQITRVYSWAPWNQYQITDLTYVNNGTFKASNIVGIDGWGDDRYRIRVVFDDNLLETYGEKATNLSELALTNNGQWGNQDGLPERNFKLPSKYRNTGLPFDMEVNFNTSPDYTHSIADHVASTIPDVLTISGSALAESTGSEMHLKRIGSYFEIITSLTSGTLTVSDAMIESETIETDGVTPYLVRVYYSEAVPVLSIQKVNKLTMWAPWNQHHIAELNYIGNSTFKATNILCTKANWGFNAESNFYDTRYRFRIQLEDNAIETYGPKSPGSFDRIGNDQWDSGSDYNYHFDDSRYKETGIAFTVTVILNPTADYTHTIEDYNTETGFNIPLLDNAVDLYPTIIQNQLTMSTKNAGFNVEIISITGEVVLKNTTAERELTLNNIAIPAGIYVVRIIQNNRTISTQRIIKID
jgi:hypothetical protein